VVAVAVGVGVAVGVAVGVGVAVVVAAVVAVGVGVAVVVAAVVAVGVRLNQPDVRCGKKLVHRMVWERAHGLIPSGYDIHHRNGVRTDNRLENLELVERRAHRSQHSRGRVPSAEARRNLSQAMRGNANGAMRLTPRDVLEIRRLYREEGMQQKQIARRYGVGCTTIGSVCRMQAWVWVR